MIRSSIYWGNPFVGEDHPFSPFLRTFPGRGTHAIRVTGGAAKKRAHEAAIYGRGRQVSEADIGTGICPVRERAKLNAHFVQNWKVSGRSRALTKQHDMRINPLFSVGSVGVRA